MREGWWLVGIGTGLLLRQRFAFQRHISHVSLSGKHWAVQVVRSARACREALATVAVEESFVGFDSEWRKNSQTSVLQIATSDTVFVIQLLHCLEEDAPLPSPLLHLLTSEKCLKVGVATEQDVDKLKAHFGIECKGVLDVRSIFLDKEKRNVSLEEVAKTVVDPAFVKDKATTMSDWMKERLSPRQIRYAALDALVSFEAFRALTVNMSTSEIESLERVTWSMDRITSMMSKTTAVATSATCSTSDAPATPGGEKNGWRKERRLMRRKKLSAAKRTLYENIELHAPDGTLLSMISRKKRDWYLKRELAEETQAYDESSTGAVQLLFEPSGKPREGDKYYTNIKRNSCVVCGTEDFLRRFAIVPHAFRKHFPLQYKSHSSHDVVVLCHVCHMRAGESMGKCVDLIYRDYFGADKVKAARRATGTVVDRKMYKVSQAARLLLGPKKGIPEARLEEFRTLIVSHFPDVDPRSRDDLAQVADTQFAFQDPAFVAPQQKVVETMLAKCVGKEEVHAEIFQFVVRFRSWFLQDLEPSHLPTEWDLHHRIEANLRPGALDNEACLHSSSTKSCCDEDEEELEEEYDSEQDQPLSSCVIKK